MTLITAKAVENRRAYLAKVGVESSNLFARSNIEHRKS